MLTGKAYIVTGGSAGFGLAISRGLLAAGADVGLIARNAAKLADARAALATEFPARKIECATADIADAEAVDQAFDRLKDALGGLNGVINNAGLARPGAIESLKPADITLQVNTNFVGTVLASRAAIRLLQGADNPRIVNISSASAWHYDEMSHLSIYAATKAAVERFTRDLRFETQELGIGVTCLRPGGAMTGFADEWDADELESALTRWQRQGTTMNIGMEVEDVARAVVQVLSYPAGVAVDLLEVRPNTAVPKFRF